MRCRVGDENGEYETNVMGGFGLEGIFCNYDKEKM
jgi:hypothetical protein